MCLYVHGVHGVHVSVLDDCASMMVTAHNAIVRCNLRGGSVRWRRAAFRPVHPPKFLELHIVLVVLLAYGRLCIQHACYPIVSQTRVVSLVVAGEPPGATHASLQSPKLGRIQRFHQLRAKVWWSLVCVEGALSEADVCASALDLGAPPCPLLLLLGDEEAVPL